MGKLRSRGVSKIFGPSGDVISDTLSESEGPALQNDRSVGLRGAAAVRCVLVAKSGEQISGSVIVAGAMRSVSDTGIVAPRATGECGPDLRLNQVFVSNSQFDVLTVSAYSRAMDRK